MHVNDSRREVVDNFVQQIGGSVPDTLRSSRLPPAWWSPCYTFDRFAELIDGLLDQLGAARYAKYVVDYGAPVGWRLALKHPAKVAAPSSRTAIRMMRG